MVEDILNAAGITYTAGSFRKPPVSTYAVYFDDIEVRGADEINLIEEHDVKIELYEYSKDIESERKIEKIFNSKAVPYTKQSRFWIQEEQLYQVIYEFNYIKKGD